MTRRDTTRGAALVLWLVGRLLLVACVTGPVWAAATVSVMPLPLPQTTERWTFVALHLLSVPTPLVMLGIERLGRGPDWMRALAFLLGLGFAGLALVQLVCVTSLAIAALRQPDRALAVIGFACLQTGALLAARALKPTPAPQSLAAASA